MRTTAAILLVGIMVFNWIGYQLMYQVWQHSSDTQLEARIDHRDYNERDLITVKVALHLPYFTDQSAFERQYGSMTIDGISYQYVKRKVQHDSLILMCLPNKEKSRMDASRSTYFAGVSDMGNQHSQKSKNGAASFKNLLSDYSLTLSDWQLERFITSVSLYSNENQSGKTCKYHYSLENPPEA